MIATISSEFRCSTSDIWENISQTRSLKFVCAPILNFRSMHPNGLDGAWVMGATYELNLYLFGIFPAGRHDITIVEIDRENNQIVSRESGKLAKTWNHTIRFNEVTTGTTQYTDEIEIQAGLLTLPIWLFANVFYRHRQRRWRKLLASYAG